MHAHVVAPHLVWTSLCAVRSWGGVSASPVSLLTPATRPGFATSGVRPHTRPLTHTHTPAHTHTHTYTHTMDASSGTHVLHACRLRGCVLFSPLLVCTAAHNALACCCACVIASKHAWRMLATHGNHYGHGRGRGTNRSHGTGIETHVL